MFRHLLFVALALPLTAQVEVVKGDTKTPAKLSDTLWVIPGGWAGKIPPTGSVNAPGHVEALAPGQKIALALLAAGDNREALLTGRTLNLRITSSSGTVEELALQPVTVRPIKAEGADFVLQVLNATGIKNQQLSDAEAHTTMVTAAVFEPAWVAPSVSKAMDIKIQATIIGGVAPVPILMPVVIKLRPWSDWMNDPEPDTDPQKFQKVMQVFHNNPQPGRLLTMFKAASHSEALDVPMIWVFFSAAFRENGEARKAALTALPFSDNRNKTLLLLTLRMGGQDVSDLAKNLPEATQVAVRDFKTLGDPRDFPAFHDPVTTQIITDASTQMDQCWSFWMATGDSSYLRALVNLLSGVSDFPAYQALVKHPVGNAGFNEKVARGILYRTAGWSLNSFQKTDPLVADWLAYWQKDPTVPVLIREQIASIPTNPDFKVDH